MKHSLWCQAAVDTQYSIFSTCSVFILLSQLIVQCRVQSKCLMNILNGELSVNIFSFQMRKLRLPQCNCFTPLFFTPLESIILLPLHLNTQFLLYTQWGFIKFKAFPFRLLCRSWFEHLLSVRCRAKCLGTFFSLTHQNSPAAQQISLSSS